MNFSFVNKVNIVLAKAKLYFDVELLVLKFNGIQIYKHLFSFLNKAN